MNPFEILDIKPSYDINKSHLENQYLNLQNIYHPDKAANNIDREKLLTISMNINHSYKILKNDYDRALILLELEGIKPNESRLDKEFFEAILEKNEVLDLITNTSELGNFIDSVTQEYKLIYSIISDAFNLKDYNLVSTKITEMRYISNLINKAKEKRKCCSN